ncbi:hypothetical protein POM88_015769 [Heracleum sosnowskyi]|uniref:Uncharacterized protein n=1 Tax=Heracleum sosnowskyi TaxID=360622 RepID=A0AAD8ILA6_9APIA|nr:hypothetical protein POM88_015769 [Heracleum sosnowskyi]
MMPVDEIGSGSGSSNAGQMTRENCYQRHTPHQINEMERLFQQCSHPSLKQRMEMSQNLGLEPNQIKFWFQNRRTQMKANQNRDDNAALIRENENMKNENLLLEEELKNFVCPGCSRGEKNANPLVLENIRLNEEYQRLRAFASSVPVLSLGRAVEPATSAALLPGIQSIDELKPFAIHLALQYLHEMRTMCKASRPLWVRESNGKESLIVAEYYNQMFSWDLALNPQMRIEASRGTTFVTMNSINLVENFCNPDKWMEMFPSIVSKAKTLQIVEGPSGNLNGSLRLMYAEMQMLRKPSGCIIQECLPRFGCTKVTWLEHMEVEDRPMHPIINQFVSSGVAFGAERWLAVLQRQCERLDRLTGQNGCDRGVSSPEAKSKLMDLAKRMMRAFCVSLSSLGSQSWMNLTDSPEDTVRISTRSATEPGHPIGLILYAVSTTRLPCSRLQVFDFLRDIQNRAQITEGRSNGNSIHELTYIENGGSHPGNCISLFRIDHHPPRGPSSSRQIAKYVLQESYSSKCESVVACTTLEVGSTMLDSIDPSAIPILPLGFVMVPAPQTNSSAECSTSTANIRQDSGCFLTVGLQTLASTNPSDDLNLSSAIDIHSRLDNIIRQVKMALSGASTSGTSNVM